MTEVVRALVIHPDGVVEDVAEYVADIRQLQASVGGYIEGVSGTSGPVENWHAYVNEEGKLEGLPVNPLATYLARVAGWHAADVLCGTVVFLGNGPEGTEADVPEELVQLLPRFSS